MKTRTGLYIGPCTQTSNETIIVEEGLGKRREEIRRFRRRACGREGGGGRGRERWKLPRVEHLVPRESRGVTARSRRLFSYLSGSAEFISLAKLETVEDERPNRERPTKNKAPLERRVFLSRAPLCKSIRGPRENPSISVQHSIEITGLNAFSLIRIRWPRRPKKKTRPERL